MRCTLIYPLSPSRSHRLMGSIYMCVVLMQCTLPGPPTVTVTAQPPPVLRRTFTYVRCGGFVCSTCCARTARCARHAGTGAVESVQGSHRRERQAVEADEQGHFRASLWSEPLVFASLWPALPKLRYSGLRASCPPEILAKKESSASNPRYLRFVTRPIRTTK